jgi:hypothetical protein
MNGVRSPSLAIFFIAERATSSPLRKSLEAAALSLKQLTRRRRCPPPT